MIPNKEKNNEKLIGFFIKFIEVWNKIIRSWLWKACDKNNGCIHILYTTYKFNSSINGTFKMAQPKTICLPKLDQA